MKTIKGRTRKVVKSSIRARQPKLGSGEQMFNRLVAEGRIKYMDFHGLTIPVEVRADDDAKKLCCDMTEPELDVAFFDGLKDKLMIHVNDVFITLDMMKSRFCGKAARHLK